MEGAGAPAPLGTSQGLIGRVRFATAASFAAVVCGLACPTALAQQASPAANRASSASADRPRAADKTGTDPTNFQQTLVLSNEYMNFAHSNAYLNTTTLAYVEPMKQGRARFTLEVPFAVTNSTGRRESGLSDLTLRYGQILHLDRSKAIVGAVGLVVPSAAEDALGAGKWSIEPGATAVFFLSKQWILAPSFKQTVSFAGDSGRADVNLSTVDVYLVWRSPSLTQWVILDPAFAWNWKKDSRQLTGITTLTYGRLLGRVGEGVLSGYVKPGFGWGGGRAADWSVEAGIKIVGF